MDTKTLVVGQYVFIRSGHSGGWGKVVEVVSAGVIVELDHPAFGLVRFDKNGTACESSEINEYKDAKLFLNPWDAGFGGFGDCPPTDPVLASIYSRLTKSR